MTRKREGGKKKGEPGQALETGQVQLGEWDDQRGSPEGKAQVATDPGISKPPAWAHPLIWWLCDPLGKIKSRASCPHTLSQPAWEPLLPAARPRGRTAWRGGGDAGQAPEPGVSCRQIFDVCSAPVR